MIDDDDIDPDQPERWYVAAKYSGVRIINGKETPEMYTNYDYACNMASFWSRLTKRYYIPIRVSEYPSGLQDDGIDLDDDIDPDASPEHRDAPQPPRIRK